MLSFLNRPVNPYLQMIFVFVVVIIWPSFRIIENMDFIRDVIGVSVVTLAIISFIFLAISIIPFVLIKKLKYGALVFVYLYIATMVVFYFVGMYSSALAQNAGIDQRSAANLGIITTMGAYAIIGMIIMYYVNKWTNQWNQKFTLNNVDKKLSKLPDGLIAPKDDGVSGHLLGMDVPNILFKSTKGQIDLSKINTRYVILYFFPMMSVSENSLPLGWNDIPGARGCTPQNIAISENIENLQNSNATSIGISTQSLEELTNLSEFRKLSQPLVSDSKLQFQEKFNLPMFDVENKKMYKRLTIIVKDSEIVKVFYPIFPPDKHVFEILEWLKNNKN